MEQPPRGAGSATARWGHCIDEDLLRHLEDARRKTVARENVEYAAAYVCAELAGIETQISVFDMPSTPLALRYDGIDGVDVWYADDTLIYTVCRNDAHITTSLLAEALLTFMPRFLWLTNKGDRSMRFRLLTGDPEFSQRNITSERVTAKEEARQLATDALNDSNSHNLAYELWRDDCYSYGVDRALAELWDTMEILYVPAEAVATPYAGPLFYAENRAIDKLVEAHRIEPDDQLGALTAFRQLAEAAASSSSNHFRRPIITLADTRSSLFQFSRSTSTGLPPPFDVVNHGYLASEREKPKTAYVARPPTWADVVHGPDPATKYVERDQLDELLTVINEALLQPLRLGSDRRLPALFVLGPPGSGKTTLVRRAAVRLVEESKVIVADFHVNQYPMQSEDVQEYLNGIEKLSRLDRPILLVMDDPLFADSGWEVLLNRLGRPGFRNIAVLAASPAYLYSAYSYQLSGHQVRTTKFNVRPPSEREIIELASLHGREPSQFNRSKEEEEFIVIAMEAAVGASFEDIMKRIWTTLNDGQPIAGRTRSDNLPWPVRALLITAFFHRYYALCPERLLRLALAQVPGMNIETEYVEELSEMKFAQGWYIFRLKEERVHDESVTLISTLHSGIAKRIWELRPARGFDVADWILPPSVKVDEAAAQLAQIVTVGGRSIDPRDRTFQDRLAELWSADSVPTARLCRLIDYSGSLPSLATIYGPHLRRRMRRRDGQSWLAARQLSRLVRYRSPSWLQLVDVDLPAMLRIADLTAWPEAAVGLLRRDQYQPIIIERLLLALQGSLPWQLDPALMSWLFRNSPSNVKAHFSQVREWFALNPESARARRALAWFYIRESSGLDEVQQEFVFHELSSWLGTHNADKTMADSLLAVLKRGLELGWIGSDVICEAVMTLSAWVRTTRDDSSLTLQLLILVDSILRISSDAAFEIMALSRAWLNERPDDSKVRLEYFNAIERLGDRIGVPFDDVLVETRNWLREQEDEVKLRGRFLSVLEQMGEESGIPVADVIAETQAWLADHSDHSANPELRGKLLTMAGSPGAQAGVALAGLVQETRAWLREHPDHPGNPELWVRLLTMAGSPGAQAGVAPAELVQETRAWLREHPDHPGAPYVRGRLLDLVGSPEVQDGVALAGLVQETRAWLREHPDHPGNPELRVRLLDLVGSVGAQAGVAPAELVPETRAWLREYPDHPSAPYVRGRLLTMVGWLGMQAGVALAELVQETVVWLREHPDHTGTPLVRGRLLDLVGSVGAQAGVAPAELVQETRAWLREHPDHPSAPRVQGSLLGLVGSVGAQAGVAPAGLVQETRAWLREYPDHPSASYVWNGLLDLVGSVGAQAGVAPAELVQETRAWLREHPDHPGAPGVRGRLLTMVGLPGMQDGVAPAELVQETRAWLREHPDHTGTPLVRGRLLDLVGSVGAQAGVAPAELVPETRAWLREHPNHPSAPYLWISLLGLVGSVGAQAGVAPAELVQETRAWLREHPNHPGAPYLWISLLGLVGSVGAQAGVAPAELVPETRAWLRVHVGARGAAELETALLKI